MHNPFRTAEAWGHVERTRLVIVEVLAVAVVLSAGLVALRFILPMAVPGGTSPPVAAAFDVTRVGATPGMNTTQFWVARLTHVDTNESLSIYQGTLLRNASPLVARAAGTPGQLGGSYHP